MFGSRIDYHLLKPLTHSRNRRSEVELDAEAEGASYSLDEASAYLRRVREDFFHGHLPVDPGLSYLDVGCGMGRLSVGLSLAGCSDVTGVDIVGRNITQAQKLAERLAGPNRPKFQHLDIHDWTPDRKFDVVVVLGAMEHIHDQDVFLRDLRGLLKPDGRAFVSIEPFHSPVGDHMMHFFVVPVPWMGLLFDEQAVMRLRRERFRTTDPADRYQDIQGGLNLVRYQTYLENVRRAGLEFEHHEINPQLRRRKRLLPLRLASEVLTRIPTVRDYFIVCDYGILRVAR